MGEAGIVKLGTEVVVPLGKKAVTVVKSAAVETAEATASALDRLVTVHSAKPSRILPRDPLILPGRVLITYLPAGNGHKSAAQAIATALKENHGLQAEILDVAPLSSSARWGAEMFNKLIESNRQIAGKSIWGWIYDAIDRKPLSELSRTGKAFSYMTMPLQATLDQTRLAVQAFTSKPFYRAVREINPAVVVNAHPIGADLIGWKSMFGGPESQMHNMVVVTDYFGHSVYRAPRVETTFVPTAEVGDQLARRGVHPETLFETGIPVNPVFAKRPADLTAVRQALGLTPGAKTILVQGNLISDLGHYRELVQRLTAAFPTGLGGSPLEIAVVTGRNTALKGELEGWLRTQKLSPHLKIKVFGLVDAPTMRDLMAASYLSVTKPGGLTTSESLTQGLPMVLVDIMKGGQETRNAEFFTRQGAAVSVGSLDDVSRTVIGLLEKPGQVEAMRAAAEKLGRPQAAADIARQVVAAAREKAAVR